MKTILVPVDFSNVSTSLVNTVKTLATALESRVILFHVRPDTHLVDSPMSEQAPLIPSMPPPIAPVLVQSETAEEAQNKLDQLKKRFSGTSFKVSTQECQGQPAEKILEAGGTHKADLIVMGSHGHGEIYNLLLGSVTAGVLKSATCPVLVVPSPRAG